MIVVKLQGGLGNQMFQYAFGRAVSQKLGTELGLDTSWYTNSKNRIFELQDFNILPTLTIKAKWDKESTREVIQERVAGFDADISISDNVSYSGYWQSERYFYEIEDAIRNELTLKKPLREEAKKWGSRIATGGSVSLHVRRGDYLWEKHLPILGVLPLEYYVKSVKSLSDRDADLRLFVFSDDIKWAQEKLKFSQPTSFVSSPPLSTAEELHLMSQCHYHIIANSSFSWWGAWLDANPAKVVIVPKNWFADKNREPKELIPEGWIQL